MRSRRLQEQGCETRAAEMYRGSGHLHLMEGVRNLRRCFGRGIVDLRIISPGYGLLSECDPIVPYDYTFRDLAPGQTIPQRSRVLGIHEKIKCLISSYDMVFFLLGADYITACELPFSVPNSTQIFLVASGGEGAIKANGLYTHAVCVGPELVDRFSEANPRNLKGVVFKTLCAAACTQGIGVLEEVKKNPQLIKESIL